MVLDLFLISGRVCNDYNFFGRKPPQRFQGNVKGVNVLAAPANSKDELLAAVLRCVIHRLMLIAYGTSKKWKTEPIGKYRKRQVGIEGSDSICLSIIT